MNDENPVKREGRLGRLWAALRRRLPEPVQRRLPEPVEATWFALQERVIWPLEDRLELLTLRERLALLGGGAALVVAVALVAVIALSSGGSASPTTTVSEVAAPRPSLVSPTPAQPRPKKHEAPRETLHGATPVFSPPSPASKGGEKTGESKAAANEPSGEAAGSASAVPSSPASATISSNPSKKAKAAGSTASSAAASAAPAPVPNGPPAGPAALKVAREFAEGFVVYETGGEASAFRDAFEASATPELTKALLRRPPKQPAGVKVPRAKVLNVVAGPSQGTVYKVSVALLRVGVTSELRLDMEKLETADKTAGKSGKRAEWRVTNVLG